MKIIDLAPSSLVVEAVRPPSSAGILGNRRSRCPNRFHRRRRPLFAVRARFHDRAEAGSPVATFRCRAAVGLHLMRWPSSSFVFSVLPVIALSVTKTGLAL
ncbi:hypothetical protein GCM10009533_22490 [Saccharopolyspora spinosporotrichia]|uniref:Uncharacterized protein n=1 Tax=Saccharopolyspora erythraea TaxID=1836 RepID=A0ABP3MLD5_SACER